VITQFERRQLEQLGEHLDERHAELPLSGQ
jgi:hypothetical protein